MTAALVQARRINDKACTVLRPLEWDSRHFGFAVAEVIDPCLPLAELRTALQWARWEGIQLLYWRTSPDRMIPVDLLHDYAAVRAASQVTFKGDTHELPGRELEIHRDVVIREYPKGAASAALVDLALAAGACSRFCVDSRIPAEGFVSLYETWIQRGTRREIADVVLVASSAQDSLDVFGLVTVSLSHSTGRIGLMAVAESVRRRGVGRALLDAAHQWMRRRGVCRSEVTTQFANRPACALYESAGYAIGQVVHVYHFWPQAMVSMAPGNG